MNMRHSLFAIAMCAFASATPLNLPQANDFGDINITSLDTGFTSCHKRSDANHYAPISKKRCLSLISWIMDTEEFQQIQHWTAQQYPLPFSTGGCQIVVTPVNEGSEDSFSKALIGAAAFTIVDRCGLGALSRNRGGLGTVGRADQFVVDVWNPNLGEGGVVLNATEMSTVQD